VFVFILNRCKCVGQISSGSQWSALETSNADFDHSPVTRKGVIFILRYADITVGCTPLALANSAAVPCFARIMRNSLPFLTFISMLKSLMPLVLFPVCGSRRFNALTMRYAQRRCKGENELGGK